MKILQVIDTLNVGGAERIMVTISNLLFEKGYDVSILVILDKKDLLSEINSKIPVFFLARRKRFDTKKAVEFSKIAKQFDIIHCHLKHNYRYTRLISMLFRINVPIIFHDHSHNLNQTSSKVKQFKDSLLKNILRPELYIGVSKENCSWAENILKIEKNHIFLLENFVQKIDIDTKTTRKGVVIVSNIARIKNLSFALKFIKSLDEHLTIYGKIYDEQYYKELVGEIKELGLEKQVKFVHNEKNIQSILHQYEFAIHTSFKETGPLVLIEFMAQSLPFLSLASGQVFETVKGEIPHFFIDKFDLNTWIAQVEKMKVTNATILSELYHKYFNPGEYVSKCIGIYKSI